MKPDDPGHNRPPLTYKDAGVDIDAGDALVEHIKPLARATDRPGVMGALGGFGGLFDLKAAGFRDPILVSGTDGVGTKLKVAIEAGIPDTVGIDLVAMCVNDIVVQGAEALFFLDYYASGRLDVEVGRRLVAGIAEGCRRAGCALIGGETAEMPGMYAPAPFAKGTLLGPALLEPTCIYVKQVLSVVRKSRAIKGLAHITGGGLPGNVPRCLPSGTRARLDARQWTAPPVFQWLRDVGRVPTDDMLRTFNCGLGMIAVVAEADAARVTKALADEGEIVHQIGAVERAPGDEADCVVEHADSLWRS